MFFHTYACGYPPLGVGTSRPDDLQRREDERPHEKHDTDEERGREHEVDNRLLIHGGPTQWRYRLSHYDYGGSLNSFISLLLVEEHSEKSLG